MEDSMLLGERLREISEKIDLLSKKVEKMTTLNTKIAKSLHLLPVSEKEERELQILQRKNLALAAKVNQDLADIAGDATPSGQLTWGNVNITNAFSDVLGDDFIPR